jgi:uncharacterized protein YdeI (YjbR/CyaY-like superfamily)
MKVPHYLYFENRGKWHKWLQDNHSTSKEIWLIYYNKKTGKQNISYEDSVEEALCFGWIDSIIKKIDGTKYSRKFTPRTNTIKWSKLNFTRVRKLINEGRMDKSGLEKIDIGLLKETETNNYANNSDYKRKEFVNFPDFILKYFGENEPALKNLNNLAKTYQNQYLLWITSAKREFTIKKRLSESASLLKENKKLGLK